MPKKVRKGIQLIERSTGASWPVAQLQNGLAIFYSQSCTVQGKKRNITTQHSQHSVVYQGTAHSCPRGGELKQIAHSLVHNPMRLVLLDVGARRAKKCCSPDARLHSSAFLCPRSVRHRPRHGPSPCATLFYATRRRQGMSRVLHEASFRVLDH